MRRCGSRRVGCAAGVCRERVGQRGSLPSPVRAVPPKSQYGGAAYVWAALRTQSILRRALRTSCFMLSVAAAATWVVAAGLTFQKEHTIVRSRVALTARGKGGPSPMEL